MANAMKTSALAFFLASIGVGSALADDTASKAALDKIQRALQSKDFNDIVGVSSREMSLAKETGGDPAELARFETAWNRCRDIEHRTRGELPLEEASWAESNLSPDSFERLMSAGHSLPRAAKPEPAVARAEPPPVKPEPKPVEVRASSARTTAVPDPAEPAGRREPSKAAAAAAVFIATMAAGVGGVLLLRLKPAGRAPEAPPLEPPPSGLSLS
jgi:hypothetical protein